MYVCMSVNVCKYVSVYVFMYVSIYVSVCVCMFDFNDVMSEDIVAVIWHVLVVMR